MRRALDQPENNGLLYHSHGAPGAVWGTWNRAVEFEIMTGSTGMVVAGGRRCQRRNHGGARSSLIDPQRRFMVGGRASAAVGNTSFWNVENASSAEKPVGQWNVLDLYVVGDHAVHVVNGVPVMEVWNLCDPDGGTVCQPLTHGHIQLQSEGRGDLLPSHDRGAHRRFADNRGRGKVRNPTTISPIPDKMGFQCRAHGPPPRQAGRYRLFGCLRGLRLSFGGRHFSTSQAMGTPTIASGISTANR
ncbi:MAG: DUF1080 domain-containing protein [Asticcacaulis sp.]